MKIVDVILTKSYTGFYFDDQKAIKAGAGHDGFMYIGNPLTEGFRSVRQAGEAISIQLVLEDGTIGYGDCAPWLKSTTECTSTANASIPPFATA